MVSSVVLFVVALAAQVGVTPQAVEQAPAPQLAQAPTQAGLGNVFEQEVASAIAQERLQAPRQRAFPQDQSTEERRAGRPVLAVFTTSVGVLGAGLSVAVLAVSGMAVVVGALAAAAAWTVLALNSGSDQGLSNPARTALAFGALGGPLLVGASMGMAIVGLGGLVTAGAFITAARFAAGE